MDPIEKSEELEIKLPTSAGSWKKQERSRKTRGSQGASRAAPGRSGLHARGEGVEVAGPLGKFFVTLRTVAHEAPVSMGSSRQGYWSELPCPPPGDLPNPGIVQDLGGQASLQPLQT